MKLGKICLDYYNHNDQEAKLPPAGYLHLFRAVPSTAVPACVCELSVSAEGLARRMRFIL